MPLSLETGWAASLARSGSCEVGCALRLHQHFRFSVSPAQEVPSHGHWSRADVLISGGMVHRIRYRRSLRATEKAATGSEANQGVLSRRTVVARITARASAGRFGLLQALDRCRSERTRTEPAAVAAVADRTRAFWTGVFVGAWSPALIAGRPRRRSSCRTLMYHAIDRDGAGTIRQTSVRRRRREPAPLRPRRHRTRLLVAYGFAVRRHRRAFDEPAVALYGLDNPEGRGAP